MNILCVIITVGAIAYFASSIHKLLGIAVIAISLLAVCINTYPKYLLGRANAEFNNKNYKKAFSYYEKAYKSKFRKFAVDIAYSMALLRTGNPEKALKIVNEILALGNLKPEVKRLAQQTRVMANYKLGDMEEAYSEAREMFEDGYTTSNMYCLIGLLMIAKGEPLAETTEFCELAYDYDSDNRDNVDNLLVCCIRNKDFARAKELADSLTENYPGFVEGWYHSAQVYKNLGDKKTALEHIQKARKADRTYLTTVSEAEIDSLEAVLR